MDKYRNPYPKFLIDEVSGIQVLDIRYRIWNEGYESGRKGGQVIKGARNSTLPVSEDNGVR